MSDSIPRVTLDLASGAHRDSPTQTILIPVRIDGAGSAHLALTPDDAESLHARLSYPLASASVSAVITDL